MSIHSTGSTALATAVIQFAEAIQPLTDADLSQPFAWRKHDEGVRLAILGTIHELHDLALNVLQTRLKKKQPATVGQHLLAQKHSGYRELQAVLVGITDEEFDQEPAPGEWPLRYVFGHIVGAERWFFTLALLGLQHERAGTSPPPLADDDPEKIVDSNVEFAHFRDTCTLMEMQAYYQKLHDRILATFTDITDEELNAPSPLWWEEENLPIQYRLQRFEMHLQQHLIQAEKTCDQIDKPQTEATRLVRQMLEALAEVEGLWIGATALCQTEQETLAQNISQRSQAVENVVQQARQLETAVKSGDLKQIQALLDQNPNLVNAVDQNQLSLVLTATYHRQPAAAKMLIDAGARLSIFSAAATGNLTRIQEIIEIWPGWINEYGRDGFTPLQLACFFGHEEAAIWLIQQGADINAVAKNNFIIAPIHAASSNNSLPIAKALLENGANVNTKQIAGITPLHQAAHANNVEMIQLFLKHGADTTLTNDENQTPLDLAVADQNNNAASILREVSE